MKRLPVRDINDNSHGIFRVNIQAQTGLIDRLIRGNREGAALASRTLTPKPFPRRNNLHLTHAGFSQNNLRNDGGHIPVVRGFKGDLARERSKE